MSRLRLAVAMTMTATLAVTGCSATGDQTTQEESPSSITVLTTDSPSATALKKIADTYTVQSGVKVEFVDVPSTQLATKIILAKQGGEGSFDIAQLNGPDLPVVVAANAFIALDEQLKSDSKYAASDFPQGLLDYGKQEGVTYAVPLSTESFLHWYRPDLYSAGNAQVPTTWEQFSQEAPKLTAENQYAYATAYGPASSATYFAQMLYTSGGRLLDPDTNKPLLDDPYTIEVMKRFLELAQYTPDSSTSGASADMVTAFSQLEVATMLAASGWYGNVSSPEDSAVAGKFEIAPPLTGSGGTYSTDSPLYGWLLGVSSASGKQKAAWDFLSYALGPSNVSAFVDAGAPPVARLSTTSNAEYVKQLPYLTSLAKAAENATVLPRIPEMTQIMTVLSQRINAMRTGDTSIEDGMVQANADVTDILVRAQRYKG